jgi:hypothetical protein
LLRHHLPRRHGLPVQRPLGQCGAVQRHRQRTAHAHIAQRIVGQRLAVSIRQHRQLFSADMRDQEHDPIRVAPEDADAVVTLQPGDIAGWHALDQVHIAG